jgi:uncharacterized protein (TIGR03437 family)
MAARIVILGAGMGPAVGVAGEYDGSGLLPNRLGEVEVPCDGLSVPLMFAQAEQIKLADGLLMHKRAHRPCGREKSA